MGLHKGQTGNPNGRPKGSPNKVTAELRELITAFVKDNCQEFLERFNRLDDAAFCTTYLKCAQLLLPKPQPEKEEPERIEGIEMRIVYPDGSVKIKN